MEKKETELLIIGGGPGGYTAAFYAADRGMKVTLVDRQENLGGICMNHGCIPSKALLQTTAFLERGSSLKERGIHYTEPRINLNELNDWKGKVVARLAKGLEGLAKARGVNVVRGKASFEEKDLIRVETSDGQTYWKFRYALIATGSEASLPDAFDLGNPRIMTSSEALEVNSVPEKLLVIGGGYIGLELGTVYARLGSEVTLLEALDCLLPGVDADLVKPVLSRVRNLFSSVELSAKVESLATRGEQVDVVWSRNDEETNRLFDKVLVATGRQPETKDLGLSEIGIDMEGNGFISVDDQCLTSIEGIYAIGDVCGEPMLAHKASREARVAVEAILGEASSAGDFVIPAIVFTDPEVAWCGLTETEAKESGIDYKVSTFPWKASGRALTHERTDGLTKLIIDGQSERLLGVGVCGHGAADLIAEGTVAIELGASVRDLAELIHPHPTLSETVKEAAEAFYGTATHKPARDNSR